MGIAGLASLLKWGVVIVLTISVIPLATRDANAPDKEFELTEEGKFDLSGYEITISKYRVNKEMLNSNIIRTYRFKIEKGGRLITELYVQKHFRPEWVESNDALKEYTSWALEEKSSEDYVVLREYPQFQHYILNFPARDLALEDVKNIVIERYIKDLIFK
ncbi:hypothetical protein E3V36_02440 [Candidatus Marinimicrobia bacterium MT.SAG.2]|nr:hypothetical protein E3V36_02440 [Candidatus Marinimicrobia bacterium MT.SAG.2]